MKTSIVRRPLSVVQYGGGGFGVRVSGQPSIPSPESRIPNPARQRATDNGQRTNDRGVSLILVMLSLMVLTALATAIVITARSETLASYNWKLDTQADYLAKAGIQYGLNWLRSNRYQPVTTTGTPCGSPPSCPAGEACNYYQLTCSGGTYSTFTSNQSPVLCASGSGTGCATAGAAIALINIPSSALSTNYPTSAAGASNVVTNFNTDFPSTGVLISGSPIDQGVVFVNMVLLNYQTVEKGNPPTLTPMPLETWQITSQAKWTGAANAVGNSPIAVAEEQAVVQPIYVPIWANAMYGYCSASMGGSSGTCTDAFNSALGAYAGGNNATAASGCDSATSNNVIDAGAGIGANGTVSLGTGVVVSGNVTIGSNPAPVGGSACCPSATNPACGFTGATSGVQGQVVAGPNVPTPPAPTFPPNLNTAPSPGSGWTVYPSPSCNPPTLTPTTGGAMLPGWYFYTVTAVGAWGESSEAERAVQLSGANNAVSLLWPAVTGASRYRVYRGGPGNVSGKENVYYETTTTSLTDWGPTTSGLTPFSSGSPPGGSATWPKVEPTPSAPAASGDLKSGGLLSNNSNYCYVVTAVGPAIGNTWGESAGGEICYATSGGKRTLQVTWLVFPYGTASSYNVYRTAANGASGSETFLKNIALPSAYCGGTICSYPDDGSAVPGLGTPPPNRWAGFSGGTGANPSMIACAGPCLAGSTCDGTQGNPYEIDSISMSGGGDVIEFIGGRDIMHPVFYDIYDFQQTGGSILVSGYVVLNIQNSLKIAGNGMASPTNSSGGLGYQGVVGLAVNVPPECIALNYAGTSTAQIQGNGAVSAVITAPNATVQLGGGGSGGYMIGAIRALNVSMQGGYPLHYDVQLNKAGGVVGQMATTAYSRRKY